MFVMMNNKRAAGHTKILFELFTRPFSEHIQLQHKIIYQFDDLFLFQNIYSCNIERIHSTGARSWYIICQSRSLSNGIRSSKFHTCIINISLLDQNGANYLCILAPRFR